MAITSANTTVDTTETVALTASTRVPNTLPAPVITLVKRSCTSMAANCRSSSSVCISSVPVSSPMPARKSSIPGIFVCICAATLEMERESSGTSISTAIATTAIMHRNVSRRLTSLSPLPLALPLECVSLFSRFSMPVMGTFSKNAATPPTIAGIAIVQSRESPAASSV